MASTERIYYKDTYLESLDATVIEQGSDDRGTYVVFDKTIFHPQGGGQPNDEGYIQISDQTIKVTNLHEVGSAIRHYLEKSSEFLCSQTVAKLVINMTKRAHFARLHSAGHLLEVAVAILYPQLQPYKGMHFPGAKASTNFSLQPGSEMPNFAEAKVSIAAKVNELREMNLPVDVNNDASVRQVAFRGYEGLGCGGTHVRNSSEIGLITIRDVKKDKKDCKVSYDVD